VTRCVKLSSDKSEAPTTSGAARGGSFTPYGWTSKNYVICVCFHCHGTSSYHTRQIHCKAVEQRATLIHRQYNRDWGTWYSRPPIDPSYLTSPLLQNPGGATAYNSRTKLSRCGPPRNEVTASLCTCAGLEAQPSVTETFLEGRGRLPRLRRLLGSKLYRCRWLAAEAGLCLSASMPSDNQTNMAAACNFLIRLFMPYFLLHRRTKICISELYYQCSLSLLFILQCFDAVGWVAGSAFGLQKTEW